MGKLDGKVAFITGAARGQGRSHAELLAGEGADILAIDLCGQIDTVQYCMSTPQDMDETVKLVEGAGRRIIARRGDVRDQEALRALVDEGVSEFGRLDIVLANAGVITQSVPPHPQSNQEWTDGIDVLLTGVWNTLQATVPAMIEAGNGGSIVITSSVSGLRPFFTDFSGGFDSYLAAKFGVIGLMRAYAGTLGEHGIRVNTVHPTGVNTPMVVNEFMDKYMESNRKTAERFVNTLPVHLIEPIDVSHAVLYLVSDDARYVTGIQLPVDAGVTYAS